jgi:thioesterase domain-containing protein
MGYRVDDTSNPYEKQDASFSEKAKIQLARLMNNVVLKSYFVLAGIDPNNTQPGFDGFKPESINERLIKYYWGLDEKYQLSKSNAKSQIEDTFLFESARWGIIGHVLKMAQQNAQSFSNIYPDNLDAKVAVEILKKSTDDFHAIYQIMKNPLNAGQALKDGYRVRKMLTLLSYEGPVIGDTVKYVDYWPEAKSNPKAAQMAGRIFRQSLFAVANNKPYYLAPDEAFLKANIDQARAEAEKELSAADPSIGFTDVDREILALEKVKALYEKSEAEKMAAAWKPESGDFVEKFQHQMAARRAEARSSTREEYQEAYREELAKIVGLHVQPIDQSPLVRKAVETARESISANLQSSAGWQKYLAGLDEEGQFQFLTQQYADAFLASYLNLTLGNSQYTGLTSNEQPGRFQRARIALTGGNDNWFKKSLRVSLRFIESPWNNSSFKPGLGSLIVRNIPLSGDIWTDIKQRVRSIWVAGTVGYLSQYYIWQVKFQWPTYLFFFSTLTFVAATSYWIDRLMMNIGVKPMSSVTGKGVYSWFYTWLTYPTYIPFFFFLPYWQKFYTNYVAVPFTQYVSSPVAEHVLTPVIETCSKLLGGH